jgi:hypothetical protein
MIICGYSVNIAINAQIIIRLSTEQGSGFGQKYEDQMHIKERTKKVGFKYITKQRQRAWIFGGFHKCTEVPVQKLEGA